jgi:hypothetical protein
VRAGWIDEGEGGDREVSAAEGAESGLELAHVGVFDSALWPGALDVGGDFGFDGVGRRILRVLSCVPDNDVTVSGASYQHMWVSGLELNAFD